MFFVSTLSTDRIGFFFIYIPNVANNIVILNKTDIGPDAWSNNSLDNYKCVCIVL